MSPDSAPHTETGLIEDQRPQTTARSPRADQPTETFWLRRGDQLFIGTTVLIFIGVLGLFWIRTWPPGQSLIEIERLPARQYDYQLDVNQSTWLEWTLLEGIGEKLARRIVDNRETEGPFQSVDDVGRVPGIGPKTLDRIRPWLIVGADLPEEDSP